MSRIYRDSGANASLTVVNLHLYTTKAHKYTVLFLGNPHAENRENATIKNSLIVLSIKFKVERRRNLAVADDFCVRLCKAGSSVLIYFMIVSFFSNHIYDMDVMVFMYVYVGLVLNHTVNKEREQQISKMKLPKRIGV